MKHLILFFSKIINENLNQIKLNHFRYKLNFSNTHLGWNKASDTLVPATLFSLLKYHLSLRKGLSSSFLGVLSGYASDPAEKALLLKISKSDAEYKKWKADEFGIIDIMKRMASLKVDSSVLCFHLKPLQPRYLGTMLLETYTYSKTL